MAGRQWWCAKKGEWKVEYLIYDEQKEVLSCAKNWVVDNLEQIEQQTHPLKKTKKPIRIIDGSQLEQFDSAGALWLTQLISNLKKNNETLKLQGFSKQHQSLLDVITKQAPKIQEGMPQAKSRNYFYSIGRASSQWVKQLGDFLAFLGELMIIFSRTFFGHLKMQWRSIASAIETTGYQALPIIALMNFLIGVVLAYQLAGQLKQYGADIYIVDVTGIGILREFAPLITAIILAGRTSTSFAALLGTMKVNQEIDALRTMGISPMARLVLPRVIGLMIALPLLTVWAGVFGVLGSMMMSKNMLNISYPAFLQRFEQAVALKHYILGLIKTPFFALIVAGVGCFQGFQTGGSAESVGEKTTKAAVQAIFLVIVADAMFSILFNKMGY
jgi:phospholipid/cholesterol/gamma-HCH transport system permease protein